MYGFAVMLSKDNETKVGFTLCSGRKLWTMHWKVASLPTATVWLAIVSAKYGISSLWTSFASMSDRELRVSVSDVIDSIRLDLNNKGQ